MTEEAVASDDETTDISDETEFRRPEFDVLRHELRTPYLEIRAADLGKYDSRIASFFSRLMLIDKLRETRALYGFNRIFPESDWRLNDRKALLWKRPPIGGAAMLPCTSCTAKECLLNSTRPG